MNFWENRGKFCKETFKFPPSGNTPSSINSKESQKRVIGKTENEPLWQPNR